MDCDPVAADVETERGKLNKQTNIS